MSRTTKVTPIHPEDISGCNKCHDNPSNSCWNILFQTSNVNLMATLEEKWGDQVIRIHHLGIMNLCTTFYACTSSRCGDISQGKWKHWPAGDARGKGKGSLKSVGFILWRSWISVRNFHVHPSNVCCNISLWTKVLDQMTGRYCQP